MSASARTTSASARSSERASLRVRPAKGRARLARCRRERQDRRGAFAPDGLIVAFRRRRIDVPGHDPAPECRGDPAEPARVGADIPDDRAAGGGQAASRTSVVLRARGVVAVARVLGVVGPFGAGRLPAQAFDRPLAGCRCSAACWSGLIAARGAAAAVRSVGVTALGAGMGVDVRAQPEIEAACGPAAAVAARSSGIPSRLSRSISPQPDVALGHQRERRDEMLAELAVGGPWRPGLARARTRACR